MADNDSGATGAVTGELLTQLADLPTEQALATLAASGILTQSAAAQAAQLLLASAVTYPVQAQRLL